MRGFNAVLIATLLAVLALPALAAEPVLKAAVGANGLWYDGQVTKSPSDFELGTSARASLSPHISAVGELFYGVNRSYLRASAGPRFTATDADNPNFSIGLGIQYHFSSEASIRPEEWAPDIKLGWRPWPVKAPKVVLNVQSGYGLDSKQVSVLAGARLEVWKGGAR